MAKKKEKENKAVVVGYKVIVNRLPAQLGKQIDKAIANGWQLRGKVKVAVVGEKGKEELVYIQTIVLKQSKQDTTNE